MKSIFSKSQEPQITTEVQKEAYNNPGGFVYAIDKKFTGHENVPPEGILGAWKVDKKGKIIDGSFEANLNYKK